MSIPRPRKGREPLNQTTGTPRTVPTATEDSPNQPARLKGDPTHGDIARRAYELLKNAAANQAASGRTGSRRNASSGGPCHEHTGNVKESAHGTDALQSGQIDAVAMARDLRQPSDQPHRPGDDRRAA